MKPMIPGTIVWQDLTVRNAAAVAEFYRHVIGWRSKGVKMRDGATAYEDYSMIPPGKRKAAAGVCHARGVNRRVPPMWLVYIAVDDVAKSVRAAKRRGGRLLDGPRAMGPYRFAVLKDPAGACFGVFAAAGKKR